jgi:DHA2 family multidrug resistance protein-like MFS transporter
MLPAHASALDIVLCGIVSGLGFGLFQAPNNRELLGSAPRNRSGAASGVLATVRLTGQSLGAAVVAIVLGTSATHALGADAGRLLGDAHRALWLAAAVALTGTLVSGIRLRRRVLAPQL